ncbi:MAG: DUF1449 family protein [Alphaproteobacteria bacterium]
MTLWEFLLSSEMVPFTAGFALILLVLFLEIVALILGGSLLGAHGGAEVHAPDIDGPAVDAPHIDMPDADLPDVHAPDVHAPDVHAEVGGAAGILGALGLGDAPFMVWLIAAIGGFSVSGYVAQLLAREALGAPLSAWLVGTGALVFGLALAKRASRFIARILPKVQTEAVSEARLGSRVGVITVGTARAGRPAEAKITDHFGNTHYIRVEPMRDGEELTAGTQIAVMRRKGRVYSAVKLED